MNTEILIKHQRTQRKRGQKRGGTPLMAAARLEYLLSPKRQRGESKREPVGERAARYWGSLPGLAGDAEIDALRLIAGGDFDTVKGRRAEVWELLFSADESLGQTDEVIADVEATVEVAMAEFFPNLPWVAVRHGDREHCHVHVLLRNDDGHGLGVKLSDTEFLRLRRDIAAWSRGRCRSGWGKGKSGERRLAALSDEEILREVEEGRLRVERRDTRLRTLTWLSTFHPLGERIRWWRESELLGKRSDWLELNIENSWMKAKDRQDLDDANRILRERAAATLGPER